MLSRTPVTELAVKNAPTWLDRVMDGSTVRDAGFGREVRTALAARLQWLVEQQLADPDGATLRFRERAMDRLRQRELPQAGDRLAQDVGKAFTAASTVERIEGMISRRIDLEGGSYALVERSRDLPSCLGAMCSSATWAKQRPASCGQTGSAGSSGANDRGR